MALSEMRNILTTIHWIIMYVMITVVSTSHFTIPIITQEDIDMITDSAMSFIDQR